MKIDLNSSILFLRKGDREIGKMKTLLFLALLLSTAIAHNRHKDLVEELWVRFRCLDMFGTIDSLFSTLITIIRDPLNPQFNATIQQMYDCCLTPDFVYTLNGNSLTGFDGIYLGVLRQVHDFDKRWTRPPIPRQYPNGMYNEKHGKVLARYHSDVEHDYINATDSNFYVRVSSHFFYCGGDLDEPDDFRMINATLTTRATMRVLAPAV